MCVHIVWRMCFKTMGKVFLLSSEVLHTTSYMNAPSKLLQAVTIVTCIRAITGSNLNRYTTYPDWSRLDFFSPKKRIKIHRHKVGHDCFLPCLFQFINNFWHTETVYVKYVRKVPSTSRYTTRSTSMVCQRSYSFRLDAIIKDNRPISLGERLLKVIKPV